jgi:hypothetical protein
MRTGMVQKAGSPLEFVRTFSPTADKLRTRKPNIHAVVAVSAVVAVKKTRAGRKIADLQFFGGWIVLSGAGG